MADSSKSQNYLHGAAILAATAIVMQLVITAAPYGPEWEPEDFPEDLPLLLIYLFAQRFIVEGMTAGAVKG